MNKNSIAVQENAVTFRASLGFRWKKMQNKDSAAIEALLRRWELRYVSACGKYLRLNKTKNTVWTLQNRAGSISALVLFSNRHLMPVFCGNIELPPLSFVRGMFRTLPVYSVQGLREEALILEQSLSTFGLEPSERNEYVLMHTDTPPEKSTISTSPEKLILRSPSRTDIDALAALQAGYEKEEVLPKSAVFNPSTSRFNTERIFANEQILTAELDGTLVGKINTSAVSFTRFLIGGVYVHPNYRGRGIARRMTAEFIRSLIAQGKGISLFVRKSNAAAIAVYKRLGFKFLADYRINYY